MFSYDRKKLGSLGEDFTADELQRRGFTVIARNVRVPSGEIDIICEKSGRLHFVEVKTRSSTSFGYPEEAVNPVKRRRMERCAREYLRTAKMKHKARIIYFDVASVQYHDGVFDIRIFGDI